jgi:uncharacterized protein YbaR (Trm112 family)
MNNFRCPKCNAYLNVCDQIVLAAENSKGEKGLILLHPELGNYAMNTHGKFDIEHGEKLKLHCPACHKNLTSHKAEELAHIIMEDKDGAPFEIHFSKTKGEEATYKIEGKSVEYYGVSHPKYINFFNLSAHK